MGEFRDSNVEIEEVEGEPEKNEEEEEDDKEEEEEEARSWEVRLTVDSVEEVSNGLAGCWGAPGPGLECRETEESLCTPKKMASPVSCKNLAAWMTD